MLRRVVDDGIVLVSTGGSDFTRPNGTATRVDGGYVVNGRKIFSSQVPVGDVFSTMFTYEDPDEGRRVLSMGIPVKSDGIEIIENWDAMGMRGTGSHDVQMTDVFVSDAAGDVEAPMGCHRSAVDDDHRPRTPPGRRGVLRRRRRCPRSSDRATERGDEGTRPARATHGRIARLQDAHRALEPVRCDGGDRATTPNRRWRTWFAPCKPSVCVAEEAVAACDLAIQAVGGAGYFRGSGFEQAVRDVRGVQFHPLTPELTLLHAGKVALGQPAEEF